MKPIKRQEPFPDRVFGDFDWYWTIREWGRRAYWFAQRWPLIKCPHCKGAGGSVQGYYEPEWSECPTCFYWWNEMEDGDRTWFTGRMPPTAWARCKIAGWLRMDPRDSLAGMMACYSGCHDWAPQMWEPMPKWDPVTGRRVPGTPIYDGDYCRKCFEHRGPDGVVKHDEFSRSIF